MSDSWPIKCFALWKPKSVCILSNVCLVMTRENNYIWTTNSQAISLHSFSVLYTHLHLRIINGLLTSLLRITILEGFLIPLTGVTCHTHLSSFDVLMLMLLKPLIKFNQYFFSVFYSVLRHNFFYSAGLCSQVASIFNTAYFPLKA